MEEKNNIVVMDIDLDDIFEDDEERVTVDGDVEEELIGDEENDVPANILNTAALAKTEVKIITEDVLLGYFHGLAQTYKPSSLWSYYSMLKCTIRTNFGIDIGKFYQLASFLKQKNKGYKAVKALVFTEQEVARFLVEAPDRDWIDVKAVQIFGVCGALRSVDIVNITVKDVQRQGEVLLVTVKEKKTDLDRSFTIAGVFVTIIEKYAALRSPATKTDRFFVNYLKGKCTVQPIGKNKISLMPRRVAAYLSLPEPDRYTGHCLRRSSATIFINAGATMESLQRFVGWRSTAVAEGYIAESFKRQKETGETIVGAIVASIPVNSVSHVAADSEKVNLEVSAGTDLSVGSKEIVDRAKPDVSVSGTISTERFVTQTQTSHSICEVGTETIVSSVRAEGTASSSTVANQNSVLSNTSSDNSALNSLRDALIHFGSMSECTFNINFK
ncbi:hypothetical protein HA402_009018 [Bradysia odoriphaga]|nr:hypothetical protein HA402_009018 [Bradysia odoriphaga]